MWKCNWRRRALRYFNSVDYLHAKVGLHTTGKWSQGMGHRDMQDAFEMLDRLKYRWRWRWWWLYRRINYLFSHYILKNSRCRFNDESVWFPALFISLPVVAICTAYIVFHSQFLYSPITESRLAQLHSRELLWDSLRLSNDEQCIECTTPHIVRISEERKSASAG